MPTILAVGIGGAAGSVARYALSGFPAGTLIVNIVGAFIFAFLAGYLIAREVSPVIRLGITTGFLGGFTTHSAFMVETLSLGTGPGIGYLAATLAGGMLAVTVGTRLGRRLWSL